MSRLVLIPTELERSKLQCLSRLPRDIDVHVARCGFGVIAAAARTAELIVRHRPTSVLLVGIAGSFESSLPIGSATLFEQVICYGIGAGSGEDFESASAMGWPQWHADDGSSESIGDVLPLQTMEGITNEKQLLTCCAASANENDVRLRRAAWPSVVAEDMEGFGVAASCALAGVPLAIVRGISNVAGIRDKDEWRVDEALESAGELAAKILVEHSTSETKIG